MQYLLTGKVRTTAGINAKMDRQGSQNGSHYYGAQAKPGERSCCLDQAQEGLSMLVLGLG